MKKVLYLEASAAVHVKIAASDMLVCGLSVCGLFIFFWGGGGGGGEVGGGGVRTNL